MDVNELLAGIGSVDPTLVVPVLAGLVIVVGAMVVALVRGMTSGIVVALTLGGAMSLSPTLLDLLERGPEGPPPPAGEVARAAAELALHNSAVTGELSAVVGTLRNAMGALSAVVAERSAADPDAAALFAQSLTDTEAQLGRATSGIEEANRARDDLEAALSRTATTRP